MGGWQDEFCSSMTQVSAGERKDFIAGDWIDFFIARIEFCAQIQRNHVSIHSRSGKLH
jgi:hypothetical protein